MKPVSAKLGNNLNDCQVYATNHYISDKVLNENIKIPVLFFFPEDCTPFFVDDKLKILVICDFFYFLSAAEAIFEVNDLN